jgi:integrase/recombinase XerD
MSNIYHFSSIIGPTIERYLKLKRSLGREYSAENEIFKQLDSFLQRHKKDLTLKSFDDWCHTLTHLATGVQRNRMRVVRNLCLYRQRTVPGCFVPDKLQFPPLHQVIQPYIFSETEICRLLEATKYLKSNWWSPLRQENIRLALILLYTTGLRRRELCSLTIGDYDPVEHTLLIRESKFHRSRLIPL